MIKRLRSISAELAGALLGRCGCRRRGGVGAKAAPVHYAFVGGLPRRGWFVGLLPMRARTRSTSCAPCTGLRQAALREALLVSGCAARIGGLPGPRVPSKWLVRRTRRGAASRLRRGLTCWCSATTPLRPLRSVINRRDAAARKESVRQARTALIAWTERHNKCFTYLCFVATAINAAREALAIRHKRERHVRKHRAKRSQ